MANIDNAFKDLSSVIDKLYDKFLLRDVFGKIVPGILFLITIDKILLDYELFDLKSIKGIGWLIVFGLSWLTAFAIQSFGEIIKWIRYYSKDYSDDKEWYLEYNKFQENASQRERSNFERFVVIKEGCGNISLTILLLTIISGAINIPYCCKHLTKLNFWIFLIIIVFLITTLKRMHNIHVDRQCKYVKSVVEKYDDSQK